MHLAVLHCASGGRNDWLTTNASPSAIATGDFNDDGNMDIAVTDMANNRVMILLGNGDGTFQTPVAYPTGSNPVALVAQDFDGDGEPDLAVVNQGTEDRQHGDRFCSATK